MPFLKSIKPKIQPIYFYIVVLIVVVVVAFFHQRLALYSSKSLDQGTQQTAQVNSNSNLITQHLAFEKKNEVAELSAYQLYEALTQKSSLSTKTKVFEPYLGIHEDGTIRVLYDLDEFSKKKQRLCIIADFNRWGSQLDENQDCFKIAEKNGKQVPVLEGKFRKLEHQMEYLLLLSNPEDRVQSSIAGTRLVDPLSLVLTTPELLKKIGHPVHNELRSMYWKFAPAHPTVPAKANKVDVFGPKVILEDDVEFLVKNWRWKGQKGPKNIGDSYRFLAESGILKSIRKWGFNAIKFLPFNPSMEPTPGQSRWQNRYMVFSLRGVNTHWGTPDEFKRFVDAAHAEGISIFWDLVIAHYPQDINLESPFRKTIDLGLPGWRDTSENSIYFGNSSEWGTYYYRFTDPWVRQYLIESVIGFVSDYGIDGIRQDATAGGHDDGIKFQPGGEQFIKQLNFQLQRYFPKLFLNSESYNAPMGFTKSINKDGYGFHSRSHGGFFNWFRKNAPVAAWYRKPAVLLTELQRDWDEGDTSRIMYLTNHDQANSYEKTGASGGYLYSIYLKYHLDVPFDRWVLPYYTLALFLSGEFMDMPHTMFMNEGSYNENPFVNYDRLLVPKVREWAEQLSRVRNYILSSDLFSFKNKSRDFISHYDEMNQVFCVYRTDQKLSRFSYAILNFGDQKLKNYQVQVYSSQKLKRIFSNSEQKDSILKPDSNYKIQFKELKPGDVEIYESIH